VINEETSELKNQLQQKERELVATKKQLETKSKLVVKKWYDQEPGHTVYGLKCKNLEEENQLITIGKSKNIKRREIDYMTHNQYGEMFYIRKCYNSDLAEKVLHHILDKYREERNKEWFNISEQLTIYTIDTVCDFLDMFITCSEKLPDFKVKEFLNNLPVDKFDPTIAINRQRLPIPDMIYNKNITDYRKFIDDMCETNDNYDTLPYQLTAAYRMWCKKTLSHDESRDFRQFVKNTFQLQERYYEQTGMRHTIVLGIKPKDLEFQPDDPFNVKTYEQFCIESCVIDYTYKINITHFIDTYSVWMKEKYTDDFTISTAEVSEIKQYFKRKFVFENYIHGIQLKTDKLPKVRKRDVNKIYMVNENKDIVDTYNGLNDASEKLNLEIKSVSDIIRYSKVFDFEDEKMLLIYEKGDNVIVKRNIETPPIYKYDFDTKELLQKFDSTSEAANHFEITTHTVLRYIAVENIFTTKNDENKNILISYLDNIDDFVPAEKTKVVKTRPCKTLYTYNVSCNPKQLFKIYNGPSDAAGKLKIGQCTVQRHIKSKKPLKIVHDNSHISIMFTYQEMSL
jgi:hypothetical protein